MVLKFPVPGTGRWGTLWKRNPWLKIDPDLAKSQYIQSFLVPWTNNPAARPATVKAINELFRLVRNIIREVCGFNPPPKYAVRIIARVMKWLRDQAAAGRTPSREEIRGQVEAAIGELGGVEALRTALKGKSKEELARARARTVPGFRTIAATLGLA